MNDGCSLIARLTEPWHPYKNPTGAPGTQFELIPNPATRGIVENECHACIASAGQACGWISWCRFLEQVTDQQSVARRRAYKYRPTVSIAAACKIQGPARPDDERDADYPVLTLVLPLNYVKRSQAI